MDELYLGVDGGGTKTVAVVGDGRGNILGVGRGGGSNYQTVGLKRAADSIAAAIDEALRAAGALRVGVQAAAFALAGADFPHDFAVLEGMVASRWPGLRHTIVNDTWAAWRAGSETGWGLVAIAGTGSNVGGRSRVGVMKTGFGLTYEFGSRGGATHMLKDLLYHVFRAGLKAGPETALLPMVLGAFGLADVDALAEMLYLATSGSAATGSAGTATAGPVGETSGEAEIPVAAAANAATSPEADAARLLIPALFEVAAGGDAVAQQIIAENATALGEMTGGMARQLAFENEEVEVVLAGSLFEKPEYPLFTDTFMLALRRAVPRVSAHMPRLSQAAGAYLLGLEAGGVAVAAEVIQAAASSCREKFDIPDREAPQS